MGFLLKFIEMILEGKKYIPLLIYLIFLSTIVLITISCFDYIVEFLALNGFIEDYFTIITLSSIISFSFIIMDIVHKSILYNKKRLLFRRYLRSLSKDESSFLIEKLSSNNFSFDYELGNALVTGLINKGLILRTSNLATVYGNVTLLATISTNITKKRLKVLKILKGNIKRK